MVIVVLAPMRSELRPVVRALAARRAPRGDASPVYRARVRGSDVVAAPIGVGPASARRETGLLLDRLGRQGSTVDHVIVSGIAGGLDPALPVGSLLVPEVVLDLQTGRDFHPSPFGSHRPAGTLGTTSELIVDPGRIRALVARGVRALDMETAGVGRVCEERGIPWSAFRAVSDRPDDGLVDGAVFSLLKEDGTTDALGAARFVLGHPGRLPQLARLARDSARGARRAAEAAVAAIPAG